MKNFNLDREEWYKGLLKQAEIVRTSDSLEEIKSASIGVHQYLLELKYHLNPNSVHLRIDLRKAIENANT